MLFITIEKHFSVTDGRDGRTVLVYVRHKVSAKTDGSGFKVNIGPIIDKTKQQFLEINRTLLN